MERLEENINVRGRTRTQGGKRGVKTRLGEFTRGRKSKGGSSKSRGATGARGRGARRGDDRASSRPSCTGSIHLGVVDSLPEAVSMEQPQDPKRTRMRAEEPFIEVPVPEALPTTSAVVGTSSAPCQLFMEIQNEPNLTSSPGTLKDVDMSNISDNYGSESEIEDEEDVAVQTRVRQLLSPAPPSVSPPSPSPSSPSPPSSSPPSPSPFPQPTPFQPVDLFHFDWKAFPSSPVDPSRRREVFSNINVGPTSRFDSPYEAFVAIWDDEIMDRICCETNLYAQQYADSLLSSRSLYPQSRISKWRDINPDELFVFFAIILAMGVLVKSKLSEYWSNNNDILQTPGFSAYMTINRFKIIAKCLHFNNNNQLRATMTRSEAKLFKLAPIIAHLNSKFSSLYVLSQNIALDESLSQWKGLLRINQFIRNKAAAVGIKTYEVCESKSGYLWRFEVHTGSEPSQKSGPVSGKISSIVLRLLNGLENKGHTVWMDNFYNSPALARILKSKNFDVAGTLRMNRQFVPPQLTELQKSLKASGTVAGCTSGDVDLLLWRDNSLVALISTYHGATMTVCDGVPKPALVHDYNICMGGVDKKDQMLAMYPIERKRTQVWYKKFFRRLLNVSVLNAYILHKASLNVTHRDFRIDLIHAILEKHHQARPLVALRVVPSLIGRFKFSAETLRHLPKMYDHVPGGSCRTSRTCHVCKHRTSHYCPECNVPLCDKPRLNKNQTCYVKYHS